MEREEPNDQDVKKTSKIELFNVESAVQVKGDQNIEHAIISAHTVDHDSWKQVGLLLVTSFNCGYILTFSNLMLIPLGWSWGLICLVVVGFITAYANWLLAGFHIISGQRFIRYRDLMGFVFGKEMYYITWVLQFLTLLLGNMGFILLGGRALKEINSEISDPTLRLQYFIIITGVVFFIFAFMVPTISAMKNWIGISVVLTIAYIFLLLLILVKDGKSNKNRDYTIKGSQTDKLFHGFGAISVIVVCNTSGLLPEVQSTLRKPAIKNMRKALYLQYTVGLGIYYGVSIVGYWAYGSSVSEYLPKELSGPKWGKILLNSLVFFQTIVSQHMFLAPIHEALDTKFLKLDENMNSMSNLKRLFVLRALLLATNTFITAAFPFMGDFVNLLGSFTLFPLTFVFPSMIYIKIKGKTARSEQKVWHWANIVVFSLMAVITTVSAVRLIVNNAQKYSLFADT
ncbi:hypothetical protein AQUCO_01100420v1 [Aquilegia coerulea]|uniref:Amino acid transporter transmembrane domain-containing protein n=1 Tax=Aquilegia coerulea TaxID=218851 RepID=A0A2G5E727_AQUCA|nr:hypothetical protein AQUCO_01100420v1 [Aquilegia coerulea]